MGLFLYCSTPTESELIKSAVDITEAVETRDRSQRNIRSVIHVQLLAVSTRKSHICLLLTHYIIQRVIALVENSVWSYRTAWLLLTQISRIYRHSISASQTPCMSVQTLCTSVQVGANSVTRCKSVQVGDSVLAPVFLNILHWWRVGVIGINGISDSLWTSHLWCVAFIGHCPNNTYEQMFWRDADDMHDMDPRQQHMHAITMQNSVFFSLYNAFMQRDLIVCACIFEEERDKRRRFTIDDSDFSVNNSHTSQQFCPQKSCNNILHILYSCHSGDGAMLPTIISCTSRMSDWLAILWCVWWCVMYIRTFALLLSLSSQENADDDEMRNIG